MPDINETLKAASDFKDKINDNQKIRKLLTRWNPLMHFETKDSGFKLTFKMNGGRAESIEEGHIGDADLTVIFPTAKDLIDMFSGKLDPTPMYLSGDILVKGHQADVIKLDAITMILWPES